MEKEKSAVTQQILTLILEILYLLTGEDYIIVKKPGRQTPHKNRLQVVEGICRTLGNVLRTPMHSVTPKEDSKQKILKLTSKITEMLTREVPIRCQDVAVVFSMEEWEYIEEHKEMYKNVTMEDHQNTVLLDGSICINSPFNNVTADLVNEDGMPMDTESGTERLNIHNPRAMQIISNGMIAEKTSGYQNGNFSDVVPSCNPSIHIKEEPCDASWDGRNVPITTTHPPAQLKSIHIKEELTAHDEENARDPGSYTHTDRPPPMMEEPIPCARHNITQANLHRFTNPTQYASTYNTEEPISCDRGNLTKSIIHTQKQPSLSIMEKAASSNKEDLNDSNLVVQPLPIHIKEGPVSCEDRKDPKTRRYLTQQSTSTLVKQKRAAPYKRRKHRNLKNTLKEPSIKSSIPGDPKAEVNNEESNKPSIESATSEDPKTEVNNEESNNSSIYSVRQSADAMEILYHCPSCHKGFFSNLDLARHQVIHTVDKLFICSLCGKSFTELSFLVKHQVIHTDLKKCVCPVCGGCFYSETSLAKHQKSHLLPVYCSTCGRCFFNKTELEIHKLKHTGEKPYSCDTCGKPFLAKSVLNKHMLTHKQAEQPE